MFGKPKISPVTHKKSIIFITHLTSTATNQFNIICPCRLGPHTFLAILCKECLICKAINSNDFLFLFLKLKWKLLQYVCHQGFDYICELANFEDFCPARGQFIHPVGVWIAPSCEAISHILIMFDYMDYTLSNPISTLPPLCWQNFTHTAFHLFVLVTTDWSGLTRPRLRTYVPSAWVGLPEGVCNDS